MLDSVWQDAVVTDDAVTQCLIDVRKALDDSKQEFVRTVPRRGYIFDAQVEALERVPAEVSERSGMSMRAVALSVAVAAAVLLIAWSFLPMTSPSGNSATTVPLSSDEIPAIAVLPFAVLSDDLNQIYFADGVSEEILNELAMQRGLKVIARTSSFAFRDREADVQAIGAALGVSHVLEGNIRKYDDTIRIGVKLVDARTGEYLWTDSFDRELSASNLFAIQDEIASSVVGWIESEFELGERKFRSRFPTEDLGALESYFAGRQLMESRKPGPLSQAIEKFEEAVQLDESFALAYVGLADAYRLLSNYGGMPYDRANDRMRTAIERALAIDDRIGEAHASLANLLKRTGKLREAEIAFQRAVDLSPNYAPAYQWHGEFLAITLGRPEEGVRFAGMAVALDPMSAIINADYARALSAAGRNEEALRQLEIALTIDPSFSAGYLRKSRVLSKGLGQVGASIQVAEEAVRADPQSRGPRQRLAYAYLALGDLEAAREYMEQAMRLAPEHSAPLLVKLRLQLLESDDVGARQTAREMLERSRHMLTHMESALRVLRDHNFAIGSQSTALEDYRHYFPELLVEQDTDVNGANFQVAIDLAFVLMSLGREEHAEALLDGAESVIEKMFRTGFTGFGIADVRAHAVRGDHAAALIALREAADAGWRDGWRTALNHDLILAPLRDTAEFQAIYNDMEADMANQRRVLAAAR